MLQCLLLHYPPVVDNFEGVILKTARGLLYVLPFYFFLVYYRGANITK